ncbi:hypothetical protein [Methylobacterium sp. J-078]|uniref:hypothetical protein n=1 Tax=Methylobacterium sp. J-078 TaxID=2836657 RepID=UPI00391C4A7C
MQPSRWRRDRVGDRIDQVAAAVAVAVHGEALVGGLGLTIGTVSRTLSRLDRDGCILIVPGGVRLIDQARLDRMSAH